MVSEINNEVKPDRAEATGREGDRDQIGAHIN